ncbi:MAG: lipoprotein [Ignavibacteriales bacterium]|nr:lipoprotein [Ignavibacteriales bacterium]
MKKIRILFLFLAVLLLSGCLREMKEKEITISVKEEDPIKVLQGLTRETRKTEVMILGCPHFKTLQKNIKAELFDSLLSALSLFAPDQIGIQSLAPNYIRFLLNTNTELNNLLKDEINDAVNLGLIAQKKLKTNF